MNMLNKVVTLFLIMYVLLCCNGHVLIEDYKAHPCIRSCDTNSPMICEYNFTVEYYYTLTKKACYDCPFNKSDCIRPHCIPADGTPRALRTVNRMVPGPGIHVCYNDTIVVTVYNRLGASEGTSIHWHGVHHRDSQYMDGVPMVTQCPILPYTSFQYRFKASTPGTHFWHAHSGMQRSDGVFGPLVIRQSPELDPHFIRYDVDTPEYSVVINDWLTELSVNKFYRHYYGTGDNQPSSILINGKGAFYNFTRANGSTINTPLEIFKVRPGLRYRFRLISNGLLYCPKQFLIDQHNLTVIATDGAPVEPMEVESLTLVSGERYDVIVHANQDVDNYWMRVRGQGDCTVKKASQLAIVKYDGASEGAPNNPTDYLYRYRKCRELNPSNRRKTEEYITVTALKSTIGDEPGVKEIPDKKYYLALNNYKIENFRSMNPSYHPHSAMSDHHMYTPQINRISNVFPPSPILSQYTDIPKDMICNDETLLRMRNCSDVFCECVHVLKVGLGDTVELILIDEGPIFDANHPMHLHGNYFRVIGMDWLNRLTIEEVKRLDELGLLKRNLTTPVLKDTVTVPKGGYTIVRFHATNPGFWFFHCHNEFHAEMGMGLIFQVGETHEHPQMPQNFPKCGSWK